MPDPAPAADLTGRTLGDFHVLRPLGRGGMGTVYLARQLSLKRDVALKLLHDEKAADATALRRFQAEAEAVARVSHPNIVQVYAVGEADGLKYMALEYVDGRNLRDYLAKKGPPELPLALAIIRQVAAALQRAAELGIVHRDIKPENILLTRKAEVKVADFGLSRLTTPDQQPLHLTQSGVALGTPLYMAPEQVQGQPVDHRTDVYSLGVTCYHLLAGEPPFKGNTAFEVAMKHVHEPVPSLAAVRPDLPADLCAMVGKMMAKKPDDRYPSARDILRDLAKVREGMPLGLTAMVKITGPLPTYAPSAPTGPFPIRQNPWPARVLAGLGLGAAAAGGWWAYGATHPAPTKFAGPGLPDARPPDPVTSSRERELLKIARERGSRPAEVEAALIDLGLLYVKERRFEEARKAFDDLDRERPEFARPPGGGGRPKGPFEFRQAARLGRGVVFAYQDRAAESVDEFRSAVERGGPGTPGAKRLFLEHPDLARAVSEALHRDAENLAAEGKKLPATLDELRVSPRGG